VNSAEGTTISGGLAFYASGVKQITRDRTGAKLQNELDQASSQRDAAQAQAAVDESYAQAVEPVVLRGLLAGQRLLIITEPGASASVVTAISAAATADAGATVTGQIALEPQFFDSSGTAQGSLGQVTMAMARAWPAG